MDFLKEFSKQFSGKGRSTPDKPREGTGLNRHDAKLAEAKASLNRLYERYGRACYAARTGQGDPAGTHELALRIQATLLQVEELTDARDAARELKRCLNCGAVFGKEARFCSHCGKRLPEAAPRPEPVQPGEYCPECGAQREAGDSRCPMCGLDFCAPAEPAPVPAETLSDDIPAPEEPDGTIE